MIKKTVIDQYLSAGKNLILLNERVPIDKNWTKATVDTKTIYAHEGNLGWALGEEDLVIDVDPRNGGVESFEKLCSDLDLKFEPTVVTASGGFHVYCKIPEEFQGLNLRKTLVDYPGIDFLKKGNQCVIVGSLAKPHKSLGLKGKKEYSWADDVLGCFEQTEIGDKIVTLLHSDHTSNDDSELDEFDSLMARDNSSWTEEQVLDLLSRLDPSMGHDEWFKVGMALHDWDKNQGLRVWEEWSKDGKNYEEGVTEAKWRSFKPGKGVSFGTIYYMAKDADWEVSEQLLKKYVGKIKGCESEKTLEKDVLPEIRKQNFDRVSTEKICQYVQKWYKSQLGISMSRGIVRDMIKPKQEVIVMTPEKAPDWCKEWIFIEHNNAYFDLNAMFMCKSEAFNIRNGKYVPSENGYKVSASKYCADRGFVDTAQNVAYLPHIPERIVFDGKKRVLNIFNPDSVPEAAEEYTEDGLKTIEIIKTHILTLCGKAHYAKFFIEYLAHNVQFMGTKLLYAPTIQSIPGVGKSFFARTMRACLGHENVGVVSPSQITSDFNEWATNRCVNILEEIRVKGHNRYEAINALKPLITDDIIMINDKGVKPYNTLNTCNYITFTNFKDAIPMEENDRRFWVIFCQYNTLEDFAAACGYDGKHYFDVLFSRLNKHGPQIRKWLLEYKISDSFMAIKQAPMTEFKKNMITAEEMAFEGLLEARELIEEKGRFFNDLCVSSSDFFEKLVFEHPELQISNRGKNQILSKLGFDPHPGPVKIEGKSRRIWTKKSMTTDEIRFFLKDHSEVLADRVKHFDVIEDENSDFDDL